MSTQSGWQAWGEKLEVGKFQAWQHVYSRLIKYDQAFVRAGISDVCSGFALRTPYVCAMDAAAWQQRQGKAAADLHGALEATRTHAVLLSRGCVRVRDLLFTVENHAWQRSPSTCCNASPHSPCSCLHQQNSCCQKQINMSA